MCKLDAGVAAACTSAHTYTNLAAGAHTFAVVASDLTNNTDPTPAERTWTIGESASLSKLLISPSSFLAARNGPTIARKVFGATVRYVVSAASQVRFQVQRAARGRRSGHRCRAHGQGRKCTRWVTAKHGTFTRPSAEGANAFHFSGRLHGRRLKPGRYRLVATPVPRPKRHPSKAATFRIKKPKL
jgi:hypothetical protein